MRYPRPGEPIVPRLLRPLVLDRHPGAPKDADSELLSRDSLGADAWNRLPPETCRRASLLVVDRVQTRLRALPKALRDAPLPSPETVLRLPLELRTVNTLKRAGKPPSHAGPWTIGRYLSIRRFGGRALVDLLAALEARGGVSEQSSASGTDGERALDRLLLTIARRLPIAESRLNDELVREGHSTSPLDVTQLLKTAAQLGHEIPFRVIDLGESRVVVRLADLTAARTVYRIATRTVQMAGAATIDTITGQANAAGSSTVDEVFVERLLGGLATFRWLDHRSGWFLLVQRSNPLVANVRKVLSVVTRVPLHRLAAVLFRSRAFPRPSTAVVQGLCGAVPEAHVRDGVVTVDRPLDRRAHLKDEESRVVKFLEVAGGALSGTQLRWLVREIGLAWTPIWRLLRSSPLFEESPDGLFRLVGSI